MPTFNRDFEMYYAGCVVQHKKHGEVRVRGVGSSDIEPYCILEKGNRGGELFQETDITNLNFQLPDLGYYQYDKTVGYLSIRQGRSYKKGLYPGNIVVFFPQMDEYDELRKSLPNRERVKYFNRTFVPVEEITKELESKFAVVIHRNYAVVKKGSHQHPVVFYRQEPVALFVDGDFAPLNEGDNIYVDKLKWELGYE